MSDKITRKYYPTIEWQCPVCEKSHPMGRNSCKHPDRGDKFDRTKGKIVNLKKEM